MASGLFVFLLPFAVCLVLARCDNDNELRAIFRQRRSGSSDQLMAHFAAARRPHVPVLYRQPTYVFELWRELNDKEVESERNSQGKDKAVVGPQLTKIGLESLLKGQRRFRCKNKLITPNNC